MTVSVNFIGRLGNNLFQYSLGRIIAEELGFSLICTSPVLPPDSGLSRLCEMGPSTFLATSADAFPRAHMHIAGRAYNSPCQLLSPAGYPNWDMHTIDLAAVLEEREARLIRLGGFFQRSEYYLPYRDRIRSWLLPGRRPPQLNFNNNDVVINIRGGDDFEQLGWVIETSYYIHALARMRNVGRVYLCGVGIPPDLPLALRHYNPVVVSGSPIDQFDLLIAAPRLILANSTFSWWGGFLSDAQEIIGPVADESDPRFHFRSGSVALDLELDRYSSQPCTFANPRLSVPSSI